MLKIIIKILVIIPFLMISCTNPQPQDPDAVYLNFKTEENLDKKIAIFEEFKETNSDSEFLQSMLSRIISRIRKNNEYSKAADYLKENAELATPRMYNSIAWSIYENKENLELGADLAKTGVELARTELKASKKNKPENLTEEEWNESKNQSLASILDTYGCLEKELGNKDKALSAFEEAVNLSNEENSEINENYVSVIVEKEDYEKAQTLLVKYISSRTDSKNMKVILKDVFMKLGGMESEFGDYLSEFEKIAKEKMIETLKNEIKNEPAPEFELSDLDGKIVKLSDYKGKTIIIDFWATWCGPCLQSFPAMNKAMDKLSKNSNVEFLFANTRERVEEKKQNAIDFINANNYPFHVLLDDQNEVVENYKVRYIPTKFIIDKNQNIRFESVGYSGKEDELVEELEQMIFMIN